MRKLLVPLHSDGHLPALIAALVMLFGFWVFTPLGWLGLLGLVIVLLAYRDPVRVTPHRAGLVISPADGVIGAVDEVVPPVELDLGDELLVRVAIETGWFNSGIHRIPVDGSVSAVADGHVLVADTDSDEGADDPRESVLIRMGDGRAVAVVRNGGRLAPHFSTIVKVGDSVAAGARLGLARFAKRVDIYVPRGTTVLVAPGQQALAGETVLADFRSDEGRRPAVVR